MAKKKFYAVSKTESSMIYETWDACSRAVKGHSNVKFKGFATRKEAQDFLDQLSGKTEEVEEISVWVDGSYTPKCDRAGWGMVVAKGEEVLFESYGVTLGPALSRNIDGECRGALEAARWLTQNNKDYPICYDYQGIEAWATGLWKTKSEIAIKYTAAMKSLGRAFRFVKVSAHSGIWGNEKADTLAKKAITEFLEKAKESN